MSKMQEIGVHLFTHNKNKKFTFRDDMGMKCYRKLIYIFYGVLRYQ